MYFRGTATKVQVGILAGLLPVRSRHLQSRFPPQAKVDIIPGETSGMILVASDSLLAIWSAIAPAHGVLAVPQENVTVALETIRRHLPTVVVLEEVFALRAEAATFVARLQTDPEFSGVEIRVLTADGAATLRSAKAANTHTVISLATLTRPMPRRAARVRPTRPVEILIDGKPVALVNLSESGTQVCSPVVLRSQQRVRLSFPLADSPPIRAQGAVAWSAFELAATPTYRAGIKLMTVLPVTVDEVMSRLAPSR